MPGESQTTHILRKTSYANLEQKPESHLPSLQGALHSAAQTPAVILDNRGWLCSDLCSPRLGSLCLSLRPQFNSLPTLGRKACDLNLNLEARSPLRAQSYPQVAEGLSSAH